MAQASGWAVRLDVWRRWRMGLGWPLQGGWGEQLAWVVATVENFETAARQWDAQRRKSQPSQT